MPPVKKRSRPIAVTLTKPPTDPLDAVENGAAMCVLASGSSGNCTVLVLKRGSVRRLVLIDLGLSPRRTFRMLAELGYQPHQLDECLVTHLDHDHFQPSWVSGLPRHARIRLHTRHRAALSAWGLRDRERIVAFDDHQSFEIDPGVSVHPISMTHDDSGVSSFRIDMPGLASGSLGFATDLGHVTQDLVEHMRGRSNGAAAGAGSPVDVLAIESNYCPVMQTNSSRPLQLKRRIMGGRGHLSNQEAHEAIEAIQPREHVVLLHLSRECNDPALVAEMHAGSDYAVTISRPFEPSRWVVVGPAGPERAAKTAHPPRISTRIAETATLWSAGS